VLKKKIQRLIRENRWFFFSYIALLLAGLLSILLSEKKGLHVLLNQYTHPATDWVFVYSTYLGDGYFALLLVFLLLFYRYRYALILLLSYLLSSLAAQFLKRVIFPGSPRPSLFFSGSDNLYFVPGVDMHAYHSFPSGHATTAFAVKLLCLALAVLVSYSRVYLSQHFLVDIIAGSALGIACSVLMFILAGPSYPAHKPGWLDKRIGK
jgi:membrane-associated phospholipid phosphatase